MLLPEVAKVTRTPKATLYYLHSIGEGPRCGKLGRRLVYRRSDVQAWIDAAFDGAW
jgi:predicted DNA-binding transcriptional regulator AlpA